VNLVFRDHTPLYFTIWIVAIGTYAIVLIDYDRCLAVDWNVGTSNVDLR
jgi:hypothetical protein